MSTDRVFPMHDSRHGTKGPYRHLTDPRAVKNDGILPIPATQRHTKAKRRRGLCAKCCCCLFITLITVVVVLGVASLIVWLALRPKLPEYAVQSVNVTSLSVDTSSSHLNYDFLFKVEANNPNKKIGIFYDIIEIKLWYQKLQIGEKSVPGFYQGHQNITVLPVNLTSSFPLDSSTSSNLTQDLSDNRLPLEVDIAVRARVKVGSWKSFHFWVHVNCDLIVAPPADPEGGRLVSKSCKVKRR
eukprot:TRINITY_DN13100_c0_g1_i1.p1 TRINITY_DN13100_c0_g1~~TRINITY_DN13100_c0_g1_i1.p1  ORF type:complete len:242 (+),score=15.58 TRINITY_DN13100_c0_g1_i1:398-1123(+)